MGSALGTVDMFDRTHARPPGIRARLSAYIRHRLPDGAGAIAAAFATGDVGGISDADNDAMRRAGLAHLLSISGLHVTAAIGAAMFLAMRLLALWPRLALRWPLVVVAAGVGAIAGLGYTLLTGAEIPTIRSLLASLIVLIALVVGREAITLRLVAAGALVVLILWPEALIGPSFQLSFAAVTAIVALHNSRWVAALLMRRDEAVVPRLVRSTGGLLLTGIAVEAMLMPIALFHFHKTGFYGALANIVAIPLTTFVVMPAEALALVLDTVGIGAPAWWVVDVSLSAMIAMAHRVADAPGSLAMLPVMPGAAYALIVIGGLWLCLWQGPIRRWGAIPVAVGLAWSISIAPPDLLITGDGHHLAARTANGHYVVLRDRAGDFVRDQLSEAAGVDDDLGALADQPAARCSPDYCVWQMVRAGRPWTILAARTTLHIDWQQLTDACAAADIVVADRRLPRGCRPRWFKADRQTLGTTGGLSVRLDPPGVTTVAQAWRGMPWGRPPTVSPPRAVQPAPVSDSGAKARQAAPARRPGSRHSAAAGAPD